jgi:probable phosphoglycerate mutase
MIRMNISYFVHSTSRDNELGLRSGWSDPPLSARGREQAKELRALVGDREFDAVFSSDLQRTLETARAVFPGREMCIDERLREMNYGDFNGLAGDAFPADDNWCIENRFSRGEHCLDVEMRVRSFLEDEAPSGSMIAIFSHKYPQLALEVICKGLSWPEAIAFDWRKTGAWRPWWNYRIYG